MAHIKDIGKIFVFVATGIVAIIVGAFMLRGNMHLWDRKTKFDDDKDP